MPWSNAAASTVETLGLAQPWASLIASLFGLLIGSFLNVVIHRFPKMLERDWQQEAAAILGQEPGTASEPDRYNLAFPGSHCPACQHKLAWWENIPVISWLMLRGRCKACGVRISVRYPLVEVLTAAAAGWAVSRYGLTWTGAATWLLLAGLLVLALIDADTQLLPDQFTLPLLWLGLLVNLQATGLVPLRDAVVGAMAGYLALWSVFWLFKLITGKDGMGYGDFKLLAALGAWLGWQALPQIILLSSVVGAVVGVALIAAKQLGRDRPMPFGPYLAAAGALSLIFGPILDLGL